MAFEKNRRDRNKNDKKVFDVYEWKPKTFVGKKIKEGLITSPKQLFDSGKTVVESEIADVLFPNIEQDLLLIGQAKGKFGGGQRRVFKQTQKKTKEGNKPHFTALAVVGNKDGYVGLGMGKAKETVPAREKAYHQAKKSIIRIMRGLWTPGTGMPHTVPFKVSGKCGSVIIELIPAPQGTGLVVEDECKKILQMAGIKDVWSKTKGHTKTKVNLVYACFEALKNITQVRVPAETREKLKITEGKIKDV